MTFFQSLYGRKPSEIIDYRPGDSNLEEVDVLLQQRDRLLQKLKINLQAAHSRMMKYDDQKQRSFEFKEGDWVWLKLQSYRKNSVSHCSCLKLAKKFYGPFRIVVKISSVAYKLTLPQESSIYSMFHIALLKSFQGTPPEQAINPLPPIATKAHPIICPEKIIAY